MKGKDPRDAHFITSRICGICGDNHATYAALSLRTWLSASCRRRSPNGSSISAKPPSICSITTFSRTISSALISANRWSRKPIPSVWDGPSARPRPHANLHHYRTIADIMTSLNPFTGEFYREALQMSRINARDVLSHGRPTRPPFDALSRRRRHRAPRNQLFTDYIVRLMKYVEFMKKVVPLTTICSISSTRRCPVTRRSASAAFSWDVGVRRTTRKCAITPTRK